MSPQTLLHIPGQSVPIIHELADQVGVSPEIYTEQSLRLGAYLALLVASSPEGGDLSMLFERPDGTYDEVGLDFNLSERPQPADESSVEDPFAESEPNDAVLEIDPDVMRTAMQLAAVFEISHVEYVEACVFFRWRWAVTRSYGGAVLLNDGDPAGYMELDDPSLD